LKNFETFKELLPMNKQQQQKKETDFLSWAVTRLDNGVKPERKDVEVAETNERRIRNIIKEKTVRLHDLVGDTEVPYSGFGPKKPFFPTGEIHEQKMLIDRALSEGRVTTKLSGKLRDLTNEAEDLSDWLSRRDLILKNAHSEIDRCRESLLRKSQSLYISICSDLRKRIDEGMAVVYSSFADDARIRKHLWSTTPGWVQPETVPLHAAGFAATLFPNAEALDLYSRMAQIFPADRDRAKYLHLDYTKSPAYKAKVAAQQKSQLEADKVYADNMKAAVAEKVQLFVNNNALADVVPTEKQIDEVRRESEQNYTEYNRKPVVPLAGRDDSPAMPPVVRSHEDYVAEIKARVKAANEALRAKEPVSN